MQKIIFFLISLVGLASYSLNAQNTYYVNSNNYSVGDGTSWSQAFTDLQSALNVAQFGDSILVASGNYSPTVDSSGSAPTNLRLSSFIIPRGVKLFGGFDPYLQYNSSADPWGTRDANSFQTNLDGDIGVFSNPFDNCYNVVQMMDSSSIDGFFIINGRADGNYTEINFGGGIFIKNQGYIHIKNCIFKDNFAYQGAGIGLFMTGQKPITIKRCVFWNDTADMRAPGVVVYNSVSNISNCIFYGNHSLYEASAVSLTGSTSSLLIRHCDFISNTATTINTVVKSSQGNIQVYNSIFWGNSGVEIDTANGGNVTVNSSVITQSPYAGSNSNISAYPQFKDTTMNDFSLKDNSPCIDAANGNFATNYDFKGLKHVDIPAITNTGSGSVNYADIGAYEYSEDIMIYEWNGTRDLCGLTANFLVSVSVINNSDDTLYNIPVGYSYDNATPNMESISQLNPMDTLVYNFTQTIDAAQVGIHDLAIAVSYAGDANAQNDSMFIQWTTVAPISTFPVSEGFENGYSSLFTYNENNGGGPDILIKDNIGYNGGHALEIHGDPDGYGQWNYPQDATQAFQNTDYLSEVFNCQVTPQSGMQNLTMSMDLKQRKSWGSSYCWFRVLINDSIYAKTYAGDSVFQVPENIQEYSYTKQMFDLSAFLGSSFKLSLEAVTYNYQPGFDEDWVRIDNVMLYERLSIDAGIIDVLSSEDSDCGTVQDSIYAIIKNYGLDTLNSIPISGRIIAPGGTHNVSTTYNGSIPPLDIDTAYLTTVNTSLYGNFDVKMATNLSLDSNNVNDSLIGIFENYRFPVPYVDGFENTDNISYNGFYTSNLGQDSYFEYSFYAGQNTVGQLEYDSPYGEITSKSIFTMKYNLTSNLYMDTVYVLVSDDCKASWQILTSVNPSNAVVGSDQRINASLSPWVNKNLFIMVMVPGTGNSNAKLSIKEMGVIENISFNLGNDTTLCAGDSLLLHTNYGASMNYNWYFNGQSVSTDTSYWVNQSGLYVLNVSNSIGMSYSDTIYVQYHQQPNAFFTQHLANVCPGGTASTSIIFNGQAPYIYTMLVNGQPQTDTAYSNAFYLSNTFNVNTSFYITSLKDNTGCLYNNNYDSAFVNVNQIPSVSITINDNTLCQNDGSQALTLSPAGGQLTGPGLNGNMFDPQLASVGNNTLIYSYVDSNSCQNADTLSVQVFGVTPAQITSFLNTSYCSNEGNIQLTATPSGGNFSGTDVVGSALNLATASSGAHSIYYTYTDANNCVSKDSAFTQIFTAPVASLASIASSCSGDGPITLSGGLPVGGSYYGNNVLQSKFYPSIAGAGTDSVYYKYTDANGCSDTAMQTVVVGAKPNAQFTMPVIGCVNDTFTIVYGGSATATPSWTFDGGTVAQGSGQGPIDLYWSNPGLKAVSLVATEGQCQSDSIVHYINIQSSFAQITAVGNTNLCFGDSVVLFANIGPNYSYQWYDTNGILTMDTLSYIHAKNSGIYHAVVSDPAGCPATSNNIAVQIQNQLTADFTLPATACKGDMVSLVYTGNSDVSSTYNWDFAGATIASGTASGPYSLIWNTDSVKELSLIVQNNNCFSEPFTKTISIQSVHPQITALGSTSFCDGDSIVLSANAGPFQYNWKRDGVALNQTQALLTAKIAGNYSVELTNTTNSCSGESDSIPVVVNTTDFGISFTANPVSFTIPPFNTQITNNTSNASDYYWVWDMGDGSSANIIAPSHQYMYDGQYTVSAFAQNINTGCRDTLVKTDYISCNGGSANPCNLVAAISPSGSATICPGDSLLLTATPNAGANYQWLKDGVLINGATDSIFYARTNGMYQIMVSDASCSQFSQAFSLSTHTTIKPVIQSNGSIVPCSNDSMELYVSTFYSNYLWSNGAQGQSIYITNSGNYTVSATDVNGCQSISNPYIVNASLLQTPEICIVGIDSATNHNMIIWERQADPMIDSFNIYRESTVAGVYTKIGSRSIANPGIFLDNASNPLQRAYRYKITAVDTCGQETPPSNYHQTIHLNINAGLNGSWNLIWEGYKGFNFGSYRIYRGSDSSNMQMLTQIQSTLNSYTDLTPPAGKVYYQLEVLSPHPCYPDSIFTKANTNYNTSRSNKVNTAMAPNVGMGPQVQNQLWMNIYPNPSLGAFQLEIQYPGSTDAQVMIYDQLGKQLFQKNITIQGLYQQHLNLKNVSKGVYYIKIQTQDEVLSSKLVIQ